MCFGQLNQLDCDGSCQALNTVLALCCSPAACVSDDGPSTFPLCVAFDPPPSPLHVAFSPPPLSCIHMQRIEPPLLHVALKPRATQATGYATKTYTATRTASRAALESASLSSDTGLRIVCRNVGCSSSGKHQHLNSVHAPDQHPALCNPGPAQLCGLIRQCT